MKNLILITASLLSLLSTSSAQSGKTEKLLKDVAPYDIDNNGYVTWTRVIDADSISKDELFARAMEYFTYNYGDGESVVQISDRELGRVVGKGLYRKTATTASIVINEVDTWHVLKIEVRGGKARIQISLIEHNLKVSSMDGDASQHKDLVSECFPLKEKSTYKNAYGQAFAESYKRAMKSMDDLEKSLKSAVKDW